MSVSALNLGLTVEGFGSAIIAAIVIAIVGAIVLWILGRLGLTLSGGILSAIVFLVVSAIILLISGAILPGMTVSGFWGAILAAIAIGVITWLVGWVLEKIGIGYFISHRAALTLQPSLPLTEQRWLLLEMLGVFVQGSL